MFLSYFSFNFFFHRYTQREVYIITFLMIFFQLLLILMQFLFYICTKLTDIFGGGVWSRAAGKPVCIIQRKLQTWKPENWYLQGGSTWIFFRMKIKTGKGLSSVTSLPVRTYCIILYLFNIFIICFVFSLFFFV